MKKFLASLTVAASGLLFPPLVYGQEPAAPTPLPVVNDEEGDEDGDDQVPVLPPTAVVGSQNDIPRDPFPPTPLASDAVIAPSRTETPAATNASAITVITKAQIESTGQNSVLEVLRRVVGVDVVQSGGPGRVASTFIRGANSSHTKVLLDGIPLNDPSTGGGAFDFSTLMVDNIERIEVLRGPQSMMYGSNAIGGVINIITVRGNGPLSGRVSVMGGQYGTSQESLNVNGGNETVYYSFGANYFETNGFSSTAERFGGVEDDAYLNATFSGRFGWTPSDHLNVDYVFRHINANIDIDDYLADNTQRRNLRDQFFQRVQVQSLWLDGGLETRFGYNITDYKLVDTDPGLFGTPRTDGQSRVFDFQANALLMDTNTLTAGYDYQQEDLEFTGSPLSSQNIAGLYVQDQFSFFDRSFTTIGVRWDEHNTAGRAQTYRFTQLFRIPETGTGIHGTLGRGFRAPTLVDRSLVFFGNPNLRPERSKGWDVGVRQALFGDSVLLDATYFRNDFTDLIAFSGFALDNIGRARSSGVELTADILLTDSTSLYGSYTYTKTIDEATGLQLLRRPVNKATCGITQRFWCDQAQVNLFLRYVGPRFDFNDSFVRDTMDEYFLVNLSAQAQVSEYIELFGRIDNVLDDQYEEVFGFSTPEFSAYGGVNLMW